jgi:hypothetical protein
MKPSTPKMVQGKGSITLLDSLWDGEGEGCIPVHPAVPSIVVTDPAVNVVENKNTLNVWRKVWLCHLLRWQEGSHVDTQKPKLDE